MSEDEAPRPPRRKRYSGKNPRRFEDKYKELNPERYADTVAKVIASGKTPAGTHIPILVQESMEVLALSSGMIGVDATLGFGGHSLQILEHISPGGRLIGLDFDPIEMPKAAARIADKGYGPSQFEAVKSNYAGIAKVLRERQIPQVDFVYADLGCSSMQFDDPARGFSFKIAGPLDMRMNPQRGVSAADWLKKVKPEKLDFILRENADEPRSEELAATLAGGNFRNTLEFASAIRAAVSYLVEDEIDLTVRRVFQAVRIAVNEEFTALDAFLKALPAILKPGGRVAILTFHSGEDRRVKQFFKLLVKDGVFSEMSDGVITAGPEERHRNPRSTSAKLRWATMAE